MFNVSFSPTFHLSHISPLPFVLRPSISLGTLPFHPLSYSFLVPLYIFPPIPYLTPNLRLSPYLSPTFCLSPLSHSKPSFSPLSRPLSKFILHQPHLIFPPSLPFSLSPYPLPPFPSISLGTLLFHPLSYYHFTSFPLSRPLCKFVLHQPHF